MKKQIALCMILCALLCGCQKVDGMPPSDTSDLEEETAGVFAPITDTRLLYYEQLVRDLQQELLDMKTDAFADRVEYESRIEALESEKNSMANTPADVPSPTLSQFEYVLKNGEVTITSYIGEGTHVTIPATIDGKPVRAIGDRAFMDRSDLSSVTIPSGVTDIGWFAFSGCVSLERVSIPASVRAVSYGAFQNCPSSMTVHCSAGSYAEQYARSYGIITKN